MRLPFAENPEWGNVDLETTKKMIDKYMEKQESEKQNSNKA